MTSLYAIPGYYLPLEGSATSASNLEWFVSEFFQAERQQAEAAGRSVFDVVNELVAQTRPEDSAVVFLPFLFGSNVSPDAKACFLGLSGWHTRGHVLRRFRRAWSSGTRPTSTSCCGSAGRPRRSA